MVRILFGCKFQTLIQNAEINVLFFSMPYVVIVSKALSEVLISHKYKIAGIY